MDSVIIFSHESDIDGIGCIILAKLAFKELHYVLAPNVEKLELTFRDYLKSGKLEQYDKIFITDLALYDPSLTIVAESSLKDKVFVFDHHKRAIEDKMNRYSFTTILEEDNTGKRCGTNLFYEFLLKNNYIKSTKSIEQFVELTRLEDNWEWKNKGEFGITAHDLAILFNCVGINEYINKMIELVTTNEDKFKLAIKDLDIINKKKEEYKKALTTILSSAEYFVDDAGNNFGIVYSNYEYRNELPEFIIRIGNPKAIKYLIVVAMDKGEFGQKSYRSVEEFFDVNEIAMKHGGGGHPGAACVNITKEQKEEASTLPRRDALEYLANSSYK